MSNPSLPPSADAVEAAKERLTRALGEPVTIAGVYAPIVPLNVSPREAFHADVRTLLAALSRSEDEDSKDAGRYRALKALCESAVGSLVSVNEHRLYYDEHPDPEGVGDGCACYVQFYPDTPIGFSTIGGDTFDAMADAVLAARPSTRGEDNG